MRGNVVNIVNERSDDVHAILCSGKAMRFRALGRDAARGAGDIVLADEADEAVEAERYSDNHLETRLGPDGLSKKLLAIAREARTAEEEQGVNILYLALGFVTWFEDAASGVPREAPLVLLPVELVRNARTSSYDLKLRDEELLTNLPLRQRWRDDFGIDLPPLEPGEGWRPGDYHAAVETIVANRPRWRVDRDAVQLGFFSFSKLLMFLDLNVDAWPGGSLEGHPLTRGLLYEGFDAEPPLFGPDDRLDERLPPDRLHHVVDADASQACVIEEARAGRNLVVQGPPGTGKSQTITNIIAAAAREGQTVLFVAEKMAALSVVHDRLMKVGLGDICLELHSRTANKKAVLAELARTLASGRAAPAAPPAPAALRERRDRLNDAADALHRPIGATGETPFSVLARQARYLGQGAPAPMLEADGLATMTRAEERALAEALVEYGALLGRTGPPERHPFAGMGALDIQPVELARLVPRLEEAAAVADALRLALDPPIVALDAAGVRSMAGVAPVLDTLTRLQGLPTPDGGLARALLAAPDPARLADGLASAGAWRAARDAAEVDFVDAAFATDVTQLHAPLVAGASSFFARWGSAYRSASRVLAGLLRGPLPSMADERLALVDRLLDVQALRRRWSEDEAFLAAATGAAWRGERTDFAATATVAAWCAGVRAAPLAAAPDRLVMIASAPADLAAMIDALRRAEPTARTATGQVIRALQLDGDAFAEADLTDVAARFRVMASSVDRYGEWARLCALRAKLEAAGLGELASRVAAGALDGPAAVTELRFARAERIWRDAVAAQPALRELAALDRHALAADFGRLERARLKENVTAILADHLAQVPQGAMGEMGVIRSQIGMKRPTLALRKLFSRAPNALRRIKPVLLMSPISVAQYLTPGLLTFDLLVIDEASQVRPEDALGAIARARRIVVVGDQKQLPPSSFFDRLLADGEEPIEPEEGEDDLLEGAATLGSLESILSLCEARGLPSRMLRWHYRSRDPSLIRVSNREFYDDGLILPPSPLERDPAYGLTFTRVDGVYDRGGRRDNRLEGEAIARRVAEHARAHPDLSLGIVTFSSAQKNTVTELLELARRTDPALDGFLREGQAEDVFVKNIENVQGDERDVILISVGYGPATPGGRLTSMTFGPVNGDGGERRLNVLFTRARIRCEVFASFDPADIDPSRTARDGPRILKRFLEYARSGKLEEAAPTGAPADTPFEEDVADVIRSFGYLADPQVGSAGFRIDLGVRHPDKPGRYLLAVECDGATYHSALWARERDRLRQDVLEHLGWRFHRVWSTDWFHRRPAEIERLRAALAAAREGAEAGVRLDGANRAGARPVVEAAPAAEAFVVPEAAARVMPPYLKSMVSVRSAVEPHEAPIALLAKLVGQIVEAEGPVHLDEVARRVATGFGKDRVGGRILAATLRALRTAPDLRSDDGFWFTAAQQAAPPVRDRSAESGPTLKAGSISPMEIRAALVIAREDNAGGADGDLIRTAARLMGFRRVGPELQARIAEVLRAAAVNGVA